jgi:hypothetical protein
MDMHLFTRRLKVYMSEGGRTQAAVARMLGHRKDTFNKWVNGVNKMPPDVLYKFCELHSLEDEQRDELYRLIGYVVAPSVAKQRAQLLIRGELSDFGEERKSAIVDALAGLIKVPRNAIEVVSVREASVIMDILIPARGCNELRRLLGYNSPRLAALGILRVRIEFQRDVVETWEFQDGVFQLVTHPESRGYLSRSGRGERNPGHAGIGGSVIFGSVLVRDHGIFVGRDYVGKLMDEEE